MIRKGMLRWEKRAFRDGATLIIGVDEAGRGPLAGPVVAAAVMLRPLPLKRFSLPQYRERLDDSKKVPAAQRERSFSEISKKSLVGVGLKDHRFIDKRNICRATLLAMREAVLSLIKEFCRLNSKKEKEIRRDVCVLVDGNMKPDTPYRTASIVKGDSKSLSVAAASIVAKVTRDRIMQSYDRRYPLYGFSKHKGYGTRLHLEAIQKYGPCPIHRRTFAPIRYGSGI